MKQRTHPQDFIALAAGAYAVLSPIWTNTTSRATTTMIVLGLLTAALAIVELVRPDVMPAEGGTALLGALFVISPWVMGFSDTRGMAVTAWVVGVITLAVGLWDLQITRVHHREAMASPH